MHFPYTKYSKFYYLFSGILFIACVAALMVFGLKFGIEFTGGSTVEIQFTGERPTNEAISEKISSLNLGEVTVQPTGEKGVVLRLKGIDEATNQQIIAKVNELSPARGESFHFIGPSVGDELKSKTVIAIVAALLAITAYIAFAFRKVSRPVASWKYGVTSMIALFHDILLPLGVFAVLGKFYGVEITIPIIAALLTILGFSVHDTIVIFDRIRENIGKMGTQSFSETVDVSLNQTAGRSASTGSTVLIVLLFVFFLGGDTLKYFALALIIGITAGTYSSIYIAGPLLATWQKWSEKRAVAK